MMGSADETIPTFLASLKTVDFSDGNSFELLEPLTNFRHCHDGTPREARIVYNCRRVSSSSQQHDKNEYIMKVKVQVQGPGCEPEEGPSTTTAAELNALDIFTKADTPIAPHLVSWKKQVQGTDGLMPGGYLTFLVMTKMAGNALFDMRYVDFPKAKKDEITQIFLQALQSIYDLGVEPIDRGLRNVLWDEEARSCSIIDFELWNPTSDTIGDETKQLQRWGLIRAPPAKDHWAAWNLMGR